MKLTSRRLFGATIAAALALTAAACSAEAPPAPVLSGGSQASQAAPAPTQTGSIGGTSQPTPSATHDSPSYFASRDAETEAVAKEFAQATGACATSELKTFGESNLDYTCGKYLVSTNAGLPDEYAPQQQGEVVVGLAPGGGQSSLFWRVPLDQRVTGSKTADAAARWLAGKVRKIDPFELTVYAPGTPVKLGEDVASTDPELLPGAEAVQLKFVLDPVMWDGCTPGAANGSYTTLAGTSFIVSERSIFVAFTDEAKDQNAALKSLASDLKNTCRDPHVGSVTGTGWAVLGTDLAGLKELATESKGRFQEIKVGP